MDQDEEGADFGLNDETLSDDGDEAISEDDEYPGTGLKMVKTWYNLSLWTYLLFI